MKNSISLLRFLRQLSYEKDRTFSKLDELDFYMFLDEMPKNSSYISVGSSEDDFLIRIKRPFSSKSVEDRRVQELYKEFLKLYYIIQNENEELELYIANAILRTDKNDSLNYPVFTKKVNISLDAKKEIIEVINSNVPSELNVKLLSKVGNINPLEIKRVSEELRDNFYHPLSSKDTTSFLRGLASRLHADGSVVEDINLDYKLTSLTLINRNLFILAPKSSATIETFDRAIKLAEGGKVSPIIAQISGEANIRLKDSELPDGDGYFTKEFNQEQLNIVKNSYENSVTLVDGPPGSGKTHTVANMIGHFLAEGKRVLVLSKKKKALRVIKNMIDPAFNGLVVSRLMDTNDDINETLYYINEFIANHTTPEMEAKAKKLGAEREDLKRRMEETEDKIIAILSAEGEDIKYADELLTPVEAAKFIVANKELMSIIPGTVEGAFPLTDDELDYIYSTNREVTPEEEEILNGSLPDFSKLLTPDEFGEVLSKLDELEFIELKYKPLSVAETVLTDEGVRVGKELLTDYGDYSEIFLDLEELKKYIELPRWKEDALKAGLAIIDGKKYNELSRLAMEVDKFREKNIEIITGKSISYPAIARHDIIRELEELEEIYSKKEKPGTFDTLFKKNRKKVLDEFRINGEPIRTKKDVNDAIVLMNYNVLLDELKAVYVELIEDKDGESFENYFENKDRIFQTLEELYAFKDLYMRLLHRLGDIIPSRIINKMGPVKENPNREVLSYLSGDIYNLLKLMNIHNKEYLPELKRLKKNNELLKNDGNVAVINRLYHDSVDKKMLQYQEDYIEINNLERKVEIAKNRREILEKFESAPTLCEFINKRFGIHGEHVVPDGIKKAWKAKVLDAEVAKIVKSPYEKMRKMLSWYKKSIIENNREYAKTLSWYHFLKRMDENPEIRQSLKGLELTYKKIGKGTGREAKELKLKAEELLSRCQAYVPCWVMTIDDAMANVALRQKFDITVVDEASQADILSLPIVYTSDKLIAIGDDKQTTPLYSNISSERVSSLRAASLSEDFPNYHLMDLTTSLYDVLKASFPSFLLKEQFRSVPDIIEYSNKLSYDGKILPLRDVNDTSLKPALNLIKVEGKRDGDINEVEAETIVSMIKDMLKDPMYDGKTIGVVSLLGENQSKLIENKLMDQVDLIDYDQRRMMAGTSVDFQGDERDIMFISMVDSPEDKPLRLMSEGAEDLNKKRYNVAFSRARDQEFLVTSLLSKDLKTGDIRQFTIDYFNEKHDLSQASHELTPFQEDIKRELEERGFSISTSHSAGKYPIPLVVMDPKVAIMTYEGELFHNPEKLRSELEMSLILERVGWKLVPIRESKYVYEKEETIEELVDNIKNKR
ncbi:MAG: AAA domain-containing protein [Ezakiella sp.]|nr:AAA domain-containing protein [Bacillota bacterium]MDY3946914.1 AAA domain-containing protein [Ezakiella sp.]